MEYIHVPTPMNFWDFIADLNWCESTTRTIEVKYIRRIFKMMPKDQYETLFSSYLAAVSELAECLVKANIEPNEALMSHVVARGREFFESVKSDPQKIVYIGKNYQDFSVVWIS